VNSFKLLYLARSGLLILVLLLPSLTIALEQTPHRISIAISGGASKGAYEAGLNWGILKYLQNLDELKPVTGGEFRRVYPSSFTGASAGGINTLLSSLT
jgi:predicted acylesterase/phospholipase RssA